jgi:predicted  nucleic acid-binding Zn-ribbon protein
MAASKIKTVWNWIKNNFKIVIVIAANILLFIFAFSWYQKNKKIRRLKRDLSLSKTRYKLQKIADQYHATTEKLEDLRNEDEKLDKEIVKIEEKLQKELSPDMTAEEIAQKFKELGMNPTIVGE